MSRFCNIETIVSKHRAISEPEFLKFSGPQASVPQNRLLVKIHYAVELILGEVDSSVKNKYLWHMADLIPYTWFLLKSRNRFFFHNPS